MLSSVWGQLFGKKDDEYEAYPVPKLSSKQQIKIVQELRVHATQKQYVPGPGSFPGRDRQLQNTGEHRRSLRYLLRRRCHVQPGLWQRQRQIDLYHQHRYLLRSGHPNHVLQSGLLPRAVQPADFGD